MSKRIADTTWDDLFGAGLLALIIYALPYILIGLVIIGAFAYKWLLPLIVEGIGCILMFIGYILVFTIIIGLVLGIGYLIYKKKWKVFLYIGLAIGSIILISKITYWILVAME